MKRFIFPSLIILGMIGMTVFCEAIQVDGYCYLENQTIHDGTRVLFEADSPGAVTDSTFTDSSGYYQIDLTVGIYDVYFSHEGFHSNSIMDRLFSSPTTLPEITLSIIPEGIYISGNISGVLEDTTYIVEGDILVPLNTTLNIEAGATFYFLGDSSNTYWIRVRGQLHANGNETDSVKFLSAPGTPFWDQIWINYQGGTSLEYCLISGSKAGINIYGTGGTVNTSISHCVIQDLSHFNSESAVYINGHTPVISNCSIVCNDSNLCGIWCRRDETEPTITNCTIKNSMFGIWCSDDASASISNCVIIENIYGVFCQDYQEITINKCTINNNREHGIYFENQGSATLVNSIISNNGGAGIHFNDGINSSITYCDFYSNSNGNFTGNPPPNLGQIAGVNNNGDPCDAFFNIFLNPMLTGNYHLQAGSPCIDAGDPTYPYDPDSTIADIGAFFFDQTSVNDPREIPNPTEFRLYPAYPNPFNPTTTISYDVPLQGIVKVNIYNVLGQKTAELVNGINTPGHHQLTWNAADSPSGIYFVQLSTPTYTKTIKTVLLK